MHKFHSFASPRNSASPFIRPTSISLKCIPSLPSPWFGQHPPNHTHPFNFLFNTHPRQFNLLLSNHFFSSSPPCSASLTWNTPHKHTHTHTCLMISFPYYTQQQGFISKCNPFFLSISSSTWLASLFSFFFWKIRPQHP